MKRWFSLLIGIALVAASIGCATPKQKEIDAISELFASTDTELYSKEIDAIRELFASTDTELYSVEYNSSSKIIEVVVPMEGINYMFTDYLTGDELSIENWNSLKEVMPEAENYILTQLSDLGFATPISLSFSDLLSPDVPLLTSQGGEIVYEATEVPAEVSTASSPVTNGSLSNDPNGAVSVLKEVLSQMESEYETYTIRYNETSGIIEIINVVYNISFSLAREDVQMEADESSTGGISLKENLIFNWNMFNSIIRNSGYSVPISLSISDSVEPEKLLLTISNGEVVYEAVSFDINPDGAVAALKERLKGMQDDNSAYTVNYNKTTGDFEIHITYTGLSNSLKNARAGMSEEWDAIREAAVNSCNSLRSDIGAEGYSIPIFLLYSDSKEPNALLLSVLNGEIIYDAVE